MLQLMLHDDHEALIKTAGLEHKLGKRFSSECSKRVRAILKIICVNFNTQASDYVITDGAHAVLNRLKSSSQTTNAQQFRTSHTAESWYDSDNPTAQETAHDGLCKDVSQSNVSSLETMFGSQESLRHQGSGALVQQDVAASPSPPPTDEQPPLLHRAQSSASIRSPRSFTKKLADTAGDRRPSRQASKHPSLTASAESDPDFAEEEPLDWSCRD